MSSLNPPLNYVPEFCHSSIDRISNSLSNLNCKFNEIKELVSKNDDNQSFQTEKLSSKIFEVERLFHEIDKDVFKVKEIYSVVSKQSNINIDFSGNFTSIEKRLKILFGIALTSVSGFSALLFIIIKLWMGVV